MEETKLYTTVDIQKNTLNIACENYFMVLPDSSGSWDEHKKENINCGDLSALKDGEHIAALTLGNHNKKGLYYLPLTKKDVIYLARQLLALYL